MSAIVGRLVGEPMNHRKALAMEGNGWAGDLDEARSVDDIREQ
jgi:Arc/MetJ family transcription regulator